MEERESHHRIREFRVSRGLTQEELGAAVGVSKRIISSIERGETKATLELAWKIADVLNVSLDDLSGRSYFRPMPTEQREAFYARINSLNVIDVDAPFVQVIKSWKDMDDCGREMLLQQAEMIAMYRPKNGEDASL